MRSRFGRVIGYTLLCCLFAGPALAVTVRDDTGKLIHLDRPATRVVTLAPSLTELTFDLGAQKQLVATVQYSNYPPAARQIPRIGSSDKLNMEALLSYHPDLVLAWRGGNNPQLLHAIESLGMTVYRSEPKRLDDIATTLIRLGKLYGRQQRGEALAAQLRQGIAQLKQQYAGRTPISGFYQIWDRPIYTVNGQEIISHIMQLCGVRNVFANAPVLAPVVTMEAVLAKNPQMIISGGSAKIRAQNLSIWKAWPQLTAVRAKNIFYIDADLLQRTTPNMLKGAQVLCRQADIAREHLHLKSPSQR